MLSRSMEKRAIPHFGMRGIKQSLDTPIVNSENEEFQDPRAFSRWFRDFCVDNGFGEYKDTNVYRGNQGKYDGRRRRRKSCYEGLCFHELRHTQTTLLIGSKCDIKTVQHRPGHSVVETTLNIYAHTIDANDEAAAKTIAALHL